eukprot:GEMP01041497.1.p1 GENE.GEMP01041497.1~~GEMP01041497.1.p1  ORF type:complete len:335 (+),score=67.45 GEMP01041497.1:138-1142(+)
MNLGWSALTDVAGGAEDLIMLIFGESITETKATDEGECKEGAGQAGSAGQARGMLAPWCAIVNNCKISRNESSIEQKTQKKIAYQYDQELEANGEVELEVFDENAEAEQVLNSVVPAEEKVASAKDIVESAKDTTASEKDTVVSAKFAGIPMGDIKKIVLRKTSESPSSEDLNKGGKLRLFSPTDPEWIALMEHVLHDQSVDTFAYGKLTVPGLGDNTDAIANRNLSRLEEIEQEKTNTGEACFVDILAPSRETQAADADIIDRGSQNLSKSDSQDRLSFVHGRRLSNVSEALDLPMDVVRRSSTGTVKVVDATGDGNLCNNLTIVRLDPQANI